MADENFRRAPNSFGLTVKRTSALTRRLLFYRHLSIHTVRVRSAMSQSVGLVFQCNANPDWGRKRCVSCKDSIVVRSFPTRCTPLYLVPGTGHVFIS
jgi:hypothetical protein